VFRYVQGEVHVFAFGVIIGCGVVLARRELPVNRYLAVTAAVVAASVITHVALKTAPPAYPARVQMAFLATCESGGGSVSACGCGLKWFESHESLTKFNAEMTDLTTTGGSTWDARGGLASCGVDVDVFGAG
jgi:hypothetical protein